MGTVSAAVDWWVDRRVLPRKRLVDYVTDLLWSGFTGAPSGLAPAVLEPSVPEPAAPDADVIPLRRPR